MKCDIDINGGSGFYSISGQTKRGKAWMTEKVQGATPWGDAPCDEHWHDSGDRRRCSGRRVESPSEREAL